MTDYTSNIGWAYFKGYYKDFNWLNTKPKYQETFFGDRNEALYGQVLSRHPVKLLQVQGTEKAPLSDLTLQTTYPGLLSGTGLSHQTGAMGESKLGFSFDPCTGVPYVPGSSVKGALRSNFPQEVHEQKSPKLAQETKDQHREFITILLDAVLGIKEEELVSRRTDYLQSLKIEESKDCTFQEDFIDMLELELFEGKVPALQTKDSGVIPIFNPKSLYKRDIFHDAFPIDTREREGRFIGPDFITPHKHPRTKRLDDLTEPVPILFLKILPDVEIRFQFDLKPGLLTAEEKLSLISQLLQIRGVGAKTNVGYGALIEPPEPVVYEKGQQISGEIKSISGNILTVYVEETGQSFEVKVKDSKVDFRNKNRYREGDNTSFSVSSVDEKGNIKYIKG